VRSFYQKKQFKDNPHVRQLTVSYLYQSGRPDIPFIRLCSKWLKDAGFLPFDQISVKVERQKLVIEMTKEI
jgi:hypothetical protein